MKKIISDQLFIQVKLLMNLWYFLSLLNYDLWFCQNPNWRYFDKLELFSETTLAKSSFTVRIWDCSGLAPPSRILFEKNIHLSELEYVGKEVPSTEYFMFL